MSSQNGSTRPPADYHDLKAVFINCTHKRSPEPSHTEGLVGVSRHIMETNGVHVGTPSGRSTTGSPPVCGRT
jgi:hypothetical protein